jgi:hypothetical protein
MSSVMGLDSSLSLPREAGVNNKAARGRLRKLALIWIACAALSWALTVVVGYSVMRFGDGSEGGQVMAQDGSGAEAGDAAAEALSVIAPAAGTATTGQSDAATY